MVARYLRFPGGKAKAVTLSYDDGVEQDRHMIEILRAHGIKCTFNINAGLFCPEGTVHAPGTIQRRMTLKQALETYTEDVCEVACHTYTHPSLISCDVSHFYIL